MKGDGARVRVGRAELMVAVVDVHGIDAGQHAVELGGEPRRDRAGAVIGLPGSRLQERREGQ